MFHPDFQQQKLDLATGMLKAIAHPIRLSILSYLKDGQKLSVTQIHEKLGIDQATTSHHLGILKEKGVLCSHRNGKFTYYYLKHIVLGQILDSVSGCSCNDAN